MFPKVTIVTVCRNAENVIVPTIKSVITQSYKNIEYLLIDGASTDATVEIIKEFASNIRNVEVNYVSERDKGIYDAMNKGINIAKGSWLLFLNAGDTFASESAIETLVTAITDEASFVYGDANYVDGSNEYIVKHKPIETIVKSMPFCHQAILCKNYTLKKYMYNDSYRICADYDLFLRAFLGGEIFKDINYTVCNYLVGGFSKENEKKLIKEYAIIKKSNHLIADDVSYYLKSISKYYIRSFFKKTIPVTILNKIRNVKYK